MSAHDVDEYLRAVEEPKRGTLEIRGQTVAGFAAFKGHLSYLPFSGSVLGQLATELADYTMTKSSLHFPIDHPLPTPLVEKLIAARLAEIGHGSHR